MTTNRPCRIPILDGTAAQATCWRRASRPRSIRVGASSSTSVIRVRSRLKATAASPRLPLRLVNDTADRTEFTALRRPKVGDTDVIHNNDVHA